jgi:hypothetical protein
MARIEVECIADMRPDYIRPLRIRYEDNEGAHVIKIDKIVGKDAKKVFATMNTPASIEFSFKCENIEDGVRKYFTLYYNNQSCKWHMFI